MGGMRDAGCRMKLLAQTLKGWRLKGLAQHGTSLRVETPQACQKGACSHMAGLASLGHS